MKLEDYIAQDHQGWTLLHEAAKEGWLHGLVQNLKRSRQHLRLEHFLMRARNEGSTPLLYAAVRGSLDQVMEALQPSGEHFGLEHLLIKSASDWTSLHALMESDHPEQLQTVLAVSGETLRASHFLIQSVTGETPLFMAENSDNLDSVFTPALWQGQLGEMMKLWEKTSPESRGNVDFEEVVKEVIQLSVDAAPRMNAEAFAEAARVVPSSPPTEPLRSLVK